MKTKPIQYAILLIPLIIFLPLHATDARSQNVSDRGRAEEALKRTDEIIEEARIVVGESRSNKARLRIEQAETIQKKARSSFMANAYRISYDLTLKARDEAKQAMAMARLEVQAETRLGRIIEETMERIGRARDIALDAEIRAERPMKMLDEARSLIEKSRLNASQYRYQLAIKLAENARQRAVRAERELRLIRSAKEAGERRLALLDRLIERARDRVRETEDERAERQLRLAERQLRNAHELFRDGKYRAARASMERCEKTIRNLIRRFRRQALSDPDAALEEAHRLLERAEMLIAERDGGAAERSRRIIERAASLIDRAEQAAANGEADEARRLLAEARRHLREAVRMEPAPAAAATTIERVEAIRSDVMAIIEYCSEYGVRTLLERADMHLERARAHLAAGNGEAADSEARIARNLYNRIRELCSNL
jgi:hypothetical protein